MIVPTFKFLLSQVRNNPPPKYCTSSGTYRVQKIATLGGVNLFTFFTVLLSTKWRGGGVRILYSVKKIAHPKVGM